MTINPFPLLWQWLARWLTARRQPRIPPKGPDYFEIGKKTRF